MRRDLLRMRKMRDTFPPPLYQLKLEDSDLIIELGMEKYDDKMCLAFECITTAYNLGFKRGTKYGEERVMTYLTTEEIATITANKFNEKKGQGVSDE